MTAIVQMVIVATLVSTAPMVSVRIVARLMLMGLVSLKGARLPTDDSRDTPDSVMFRTNFLMTRFARRFANHAITTMKMTRTRPGMT